MVRLIGLTLPGRSLKLCPFVGGEGQGGSEPLDREALWPLALAALQQTDGVHAQAGPLRQFFLRQPGAVAKFSQ